MNRSPIGTRPVVTAAHLLPDVIQLDLGANIFCPYAPGRQVYVEVCFAEEFLIRVKEPAEFYA